MTDYPEQPSTRGPDLVKDDIPSVARANDGTGLDRPGEALPTPPPARPETNIGKRTRVSSLWVAAVASVILLVGLLVFILQNLKQVPVSFLGWTGHLPLGVALLFAAITGALLMAVLAGARVLQLRIAAHRLARRH